MRKWVYSFFYLTLCSNLFCSCQHNTQLTTKMDVTSQKDSISFEAEKPVKNYVPIQSRDTIIKQLEVKKSNRKPLVIHVYIPLCDNENQGIVPTSASLGDGFSLRTNLYWATRTGTKRFFKNHVKWKMIYDRKDIDTNVLERVVFERTYSDTKVYLVADAYRGDRMEETVNNFLAALSNNRKDSIQVDSSVIVYAAGDADLIMFNGHNGMMDNIDVKEWKNKTTKQTDAVVNACVSADYFTEEFINAKAFPLVRTQTLLHPGAYVLTQIIDDWIAGVEERQLCLNAGRAYCVKHDCGAGTKVFKTGW